MNSYNRMHSVRLLWARWRRIFGSEDPNVAELGFALGACPDCGLQRKPYMVAELINIPHCTCDRRKGHSMPTRHLVEPLAEASETHDAIREWCEEIELTANNMLNHALGLRASKQESAADAMHRASLRLVGVAHELRECLSSTPERVG